MNAPSSPRTTLDAGASRRSRFATAPILLALIALVGSAAYANSFSVPFQWDDGIAIVSNPRVRDLGAFVRLFEPDRSVPYLSFTLNRVLGGPGPESFHLVNLAIHVGAAFLVFALVRFVARAASPEVPALARHADAAAALAALLFVAHPIQTQAVTYVVQRLASLAAC